MGVATAVPEGAVSASSRLRLFVQNSLGFPDWGVKNKTQNPTALNLSEVGNTLVTKKQQRNQMPGRRAVTVFLKYIYMKVSQFPVCSPSR